MSDKIKNQSLDIPIGVWFVSEDGAIHPGDHNGKFPYCVFTRTLQDINIDGLGLRIRFKLLIYDKMAAPKDSPRMNVVAGIGCNGILYRGDDLVDCVTVLGIENTPDTNAPWAVTCEMVATFGGIISKIS